MTRFNGYAPPELEWKALAVADLTAIVDYVSDDNPDATLALMAEIQRKVAQLITCHRLAQFVFYVGIISDNRACFTGRITPELLTSLPWSPSL